MSKEIVKVKIYSGNGLRIEQDFTNYEKACSFARKQVITYGFIGKIQRIVDGKPWATTTILPKETF